MQGRFRSCNTITSLVHHCLLCNPAQQIPIFITRTAIVAAYKRSPTTVSAATVLVNRSAPKNKTNNMTPSFININNQIPIAEHYIVINKVQYLTVSIKII